MMHLIALALSGPLLANAYSFGTKTGPAGWLEDTNYFRCMHGAEPVYWDDDLAKKAQDWANHLQQINSMTHSQSYDTFPPSGENLAMGSGTFNCNGKQMAYGQSCAVWGWYNEYDQWKCSGSWIGKSGIGHFTALAWKGIRAMGCGSAGTYHVCEYSHPDCKDPSQVSENGGSNCWNFTPSKLPNFNQNNCQNNPTACVGCIDSSKASTCAAASTPIYPGDQTTTTTTKAPTTTTTTTRVVTTVPPATTTTTKKPPTTTTTTTTKAPTTTTTTTTVPTTTTTPAPTTTAPTQPSNGCTSWWAVWRANLKCMQVQSGDTCDTTLAQPRCRKNPSVSCSCL